MIQSLLSSTYQLPGNYQMPQTWILYLPCVCVISYVQIFATPWTVALQVLRSMEFQAISEWVPISSSRRLFLTWGSNPCLLNLLHWQVNSFTATPWKPRYLHKTMQKVLIFSSHYRWGNWEQSANIARDSCITYKNTFIKGYMGSIIT